MLISELSLPHTFISSKSAWKCTWACQHRISREVKKNARSNQFLFSSTLFLICIAEARSDWISSSAFNLEAGSEIGFILIAADGNRAPGPKWRGWRHCLCLIRSKSTACHLAALFSERAVPVNCRSCKTDSLVRRSRSIRSFQNVKL